MFDCLFARAASAIIAESDEMISKQVRDSEQEDSEWPSRSAQQPRTSH
jgi:hypothetical protein